MKIRYYLVENHPLEAEVATFADFLAFLSSMLVGAEKPDATVVADWAETYRRLSTEGLASEICFARAWARQEVVLHLVGVEKQ
jgi:hypothetical protein